MKYLPLVLVMLALISGVTLLPNASSQEIVITQVMPVIHAEIDAPPSPPQPYQNPLMTPNNTPPDPTMVSLAVGLALLTALSAFALGIQEMRSGKKGGGA